MPKRLMPGNPTSGSYPLLIVILWLLLIFGLATAWVNAQAPASSPAPSVPPLPGGPSTIIGGPPSSMPGGPSTMAGAAFAQARMAAQGGPGAAASQSR